MDSPKFSAAPYYGALLFPVLLVLAALGGGWWLALPTFLALVVIPILDTVAGVDDRSPSNEEVAGLEARASFRVVLYLYVVLQSVALVVMCVAFAQGDWAGWEIALAVLSTGIVTGGIGITIAHELGHRQAVVERLLGYVLLAEVGYLHFVLEHVQGHHRNVGLDEDPATARRGEPAYRFILRSAVGQWFHAWGIEAQRLRALGRSPLSLSNRVIRWAVLPVVLLTGCITFWGPMIAVLLVGQSVVAIALLELVNYVEHYGLVRAEIKPGVRDRVRAIHSWESRYVASNAILFKLQRHADHHLLPHRRYQSLRLHDESPQLPHGYPLMIMLALVPPLWRRSIHPRLDAMRSA
ncbi:MAG: alkane 1-monooxygenase [Candidatus Kapabacteria bacterium]|nr:alkane 1-monooxygenase [Candidatus Kapabacteria bacterium]